jgi:hypothetical protein
MALATGPFTTNLLEPNPVPGAIALALASDGDPGQLARVVNGGAQLTQSGTTTAATTGDFPTPNLITALNIPVGDGVTCIAKVRGIGAAVANCYYYEVRATALNLAGTLTIVGASQVVSTNEGSAGGDAAIAFSTNIATLTVTSANAVAVAWRVEWTFEKLSGVSS